MESTYIILDFLKYYVMQIKRYQNLFLAVSSICEQNIDVISKIFLAKILARNLHMTFLLYELRKIYKWNLQFQNL